MEEIARITNAEFQQTDFVKIGKPVLIIDALKEWPAMGRWSPHYLAEKCGDRPTVIQVSHSGKWKYNGDGSPSDPQTQYALPNIPFRLATDWIVNTPLDAKYYISQSNMSRYPELVKDLNFEGPDQPAVMNLWFGSQGTVSQLHFDQSHNLFAQIYGTKTVTLFDPSQTPFLCDSTVGDLLFHLNSIDVESPDACNDPMIKATRLDFTIEPGQVLFLPAFWWHHVRANDISISVNRWWAPQLDECKGPTVLKTWLFRHKRDGWCETRSRQSIMLPQLIHIAENLMHKDFSLAKVVLAVAAEELVRSPVYLQAGTSLATDASRKSIDLFITSVFGGQIDLVSQSDVDFMQDTLRSAVSLVPANFSST